MKDAEQLKKTAAEMLADGKGILAADESTSTIEKRFAKAAIENTEINRRVYRELLFTTLSINEYISGVIMYDETFRQSGSDGRTFPEALKAAGIVPGIKVDQSTEAMPDSPNEKITKGLDGLPERLAEYAKLGGRFAKWRAVITIGEGLPTDANIRRNAKDLASYANLCQEAGIVPMVEPEVLMDGAHDQARCAEVTEKVLKALFEELKTAGVLIEGTVLKSNMVISGTESGQKKTPAEIASATIDVFKKTLPPELPGVVFLSGGQSETEATENLSAIALHPELSWKVSFSFGRALQDSAIAAWAGKVENIDAAQNSFYHRAKMNSFAVLGIYAKDMETL